MKKNIVHINSFSFGSTGKIMLQLAKISEENGYNVYVSYPMSRDNSKKEVDGAIIIGDRLTRNIHLRLAKVTGLNGCYSYSATKRFLGELDKIKPDILHLHNLHNCYINLPLLFDYIKKNDIKVIWTLHDCWSFTGQCPYFVMAKCDKWKTGCHDCPSYKKYPSAYVDRTKTMWKLKKKWFTGIKDMTIVTPSQWLADLVKESFLKEYPIKVINNGIDLSVFKPTESDFRKKYGCEDKYILLGVAMGWGKRKGLDVFIDLAARLGGKYQFVLVGTDASIDKQLPDNIISIHRTANQTELAEIYTATDVFVNPTREEVLGLVNIEALACGTPVITFKTGGSPECIDENCGLVVECDDVDGMKEQIKRVCSESIFDKKSCINCAKKFDTNRKYQEYIDVYKS